MIKRIILKSCYLFIVAQFCSQKMRIGQTCIFAPCCILVLMWENSAAMFGSQTAESSICSECLPQWKLSKLPEIPVLWGVCPPAVLLVFLQSPEWGTASPVRWSIPPRSRDLELLKELCLTGGTCYWDAGSASVHFSGCSERSSGQPPPPQAHHTQSPLGRPSSGWFLLLPQLPSPPANWVWLLWVVLVGGGRPSSPSGELVSQGELLRDWSLIIYQ